MVKWICVGCTDWEFGSCRNNVIRWPRMGAGGEVLLLPWEEGLLLLLVFRARRWRRLLNLNGSFTDPPPPMVNGAVLCHFDVDVCCACLQMMDLPKKGWTMMVELNLSTAEARTNTILGTWESFIHRWDCSCRDPR